MNKGLNVVPRTFTNIGFKFLFCFIETRFNQDFQKWYYE